ncbi:hypothetical protein PM082_015871 [Marasmius tenuissimus]|nr:hypothetical protein PM082_015871 [Marasmius tenuissimus]
MAQNFDYGRDQNVHTGSGDLDINNVNNIGRDFVQNINTPNSHPHLKSLYAAVTGVGASHTSKQQFARGKCLEGTRREALGDIHRWRVSRDPSHPICWLSGTAGIGKTAIAMTVAEACEEDGLVTSFFFFRSDSRRNNPDALVPSIAVGLISKIPLLQAFVDQQISRDPTILDADLEHQFRELVLKPSLEARWLESEGGQLHKVPNLVIMDGLDECGDEDTQEHILSTILSSYQQPNSTRSPLKFLICSRPEAWIRESFDEAGLSRLTHRIVLDNTSQINRDIEWFFLCEFETIRTSRKFARLQFPSPWPSNMELGRLVQKSSSQFVYAATAVKFIKTPYSNPLDQLHTILEYDPVNQSSNSPFPELDRLYHIILSANPNREKLLSILAPILIGTSHGLEPSPEFIEILLDLTSGEVDLTLRAMHSVLDIRGGWDIITVYHTSFREYLVDRTRSGIFSIDLGPAQTTYLARRWLQALSIERLRRDGLHQIFNRKRSSLYTGWIPFCSRLSTPSSREFIADLRNVELSVVLLCQEENTSWQKIFGGLVMWLLNQNDHDLDLTIIDRFETRPKHFYLELLHGSEEDRSRIDLLEHTAVLKINAYKDWDSKMFREILKDTPRSLIYRATDCRCDFDTELASSSPFHKHYRVVCLRALKALVSNAASHHSDGWGPAYAIFESVVDSSLLQNCVFGTELLAQCRMLFSVVGPWCLIEPTDKVHRERREKLLNWLEVRVYIPARLS